MRGFDFIFFEKDEEVVVREGLIEYPCLIMFTKIWPGDWNNQLERTNTKVDKDNGKAARMVNGRAQAVRQF